MKCSKRTDGYVNRAIKTATVTFTTDEFGRGLNVANVSSVISALNTGGYIVIPFYASGYNWCFRILNNVDNSPIINTEVSVLYWYS